MPQVRDSMGKLGGAFAVDEDRMNSRSLRAADVIQRIVPNVNHLRGLRSKPIESDLKNSRLRFFDAFLERCDDGFKVRCQVQQLQDSMQRVVPVAQNRHFDAALLDRLQTWERVVVK